jgi:hypothetical protein
MMVAEMLNILHSLHMVSSAVTAKCIDIQFRVLIATNLEAFVLYLDSWTCFLHYASVN